MERTLVPLSQCTPEELSAHISLLRQQASGCENHAAELEGYVNKRLGAQGTAHADQTLAELELA